MRPAAPGAAAARRTSAAPPAGAAALAARRRRHGRAARTAAPQPCRPRALHRHVAGWLEKPDAPPPRTPADSPQAPPPPPPASSGAARPLRALRRLLRPLLPRPPLVEYSTGCAGVDPAEARASRVPVRCAQKQQSRERD
jgi:hypothetical protein